MRKPISPSLHGLIDYGFGVANMALPSMLGLTGPGRRIPAFWALGQGTLNAMTNQPYALSRKISFRSHGLIEAGALPTLMGVTLASGAMKDPKARPFFVGMFAALITNYILTDYNAKPER